MRQLLFLGTGHGMPIASSCSSILVEDETNNLLLDCGGGHDLIRQFFAAKKEPSEIKNIFMSHFDSDHILGIIPLIRSFSRAKEPIQHTIYCSEEVKRAIDSLFTFVSKRQFEKALPFLHFVIIEDGMALEAAGWKYTFFDLKSSKTPQFGCVVHFPDGTKLSYLGDEPLHDHYLDPVKDSDVLIHEAFCLDTAQEHFNPHPKNHGTVKEAAQNATRAGAKKLVLIHMEDDTLSSRKQTYLEEARQYFKGDVFVPLDLDTSEF